MVSCGHHINVEDGGPTNTRIGKQSRKSIITPNRFLARGMANTKFMSGRTQP